MRKLNINDEPELERENFLSEDENKGNRVDYSYGINKESMQQAQKQKRSECISSEIGNNEYKNCNQAVSKWSNENKRNKYTNNLWKKPTTRRSSFRSFSSEQLGFQGNSLNSRKTVFYLLFFIVLAVLFKWIILKNTGMTAVAFFVIIIVVIGHLRDK